MSWYYAIGSDQKGPVNDGALMALHEGGEVADETLVWREGMADWKPFKEIAPLLGADAAAAEIREPALAGGQGEMAACAYSGRTMKRSGMIRYGDSFVAPEHKEAFVQRLREGGDVEASGAQYAGFWIRAGAKVIDGIVLNVVGAIPQVMISAALMPEGFTGPVRPEDLGEFVPVFIVSVIVGGLIQMVYDTFLVGKYGATLGKLALGLRIVNPDGSKVSYMKAFARFWGERITSFTIFIGYVIAAFDDEKRTLHDHICSTRVIWKS